MGRVPNNAASLLDGLTADQRAMAAAYLVDGRDQTEIADQFKVVPRTVYRAVQAFAAACQRVGVPVPERPTAPPESRHVRQLSVAAPWAC